MNQAGNVLLMIFQQAWATMVALVVIIAGLGGLAQVMKIVGGQMVGSPVWVGEAVVGIVGIAIIALVGFLAIPQIVRSVNSPDAMVGCGPIVEIGQFSAVLIGAIGSLRMLKAVFVAVANTPFCASKVLRKSGVGKWREDAIFNLPFSPNNSAALTNWAVTSGVSSIACELTSMVASNTAW